LWRVLSMMRKMLSRPFCWLVIISLAVALAPTLQAAAGADGKPSVKKILGRKGRRLPPYYAQVVNEKQRAEISKIQEEYQPKIEALQDQLEAMKKERDEKVSAVLTPEQKRQVEEAAIKAKAKKKSKSPPSAVPVKDAPPVPPATPVLEK
jgi:hypothetical protein